MNLSISSVNESKFIPRLSNHLNDYIDYSGVQHMRQMFWSGSLKQQKIEILKNMKVSYGSISDVFWAFL